MQLSTNPSYDRLMTDDRNYHIVFLVVGGLFLLLLLRLSVFSWAQFKRSARRIFERRTYFSFGAASLTLGLLAVAFWANVTSVVKHAIDEP